MPEPIELTEADRRILRVIQEEGRISNVALAERVGMSPSPCLRRLKRLEEAGVIDGYRARLDEQALGFGVVALVSVKLEKHTRERFDALIQAIQALDAVTDCYAVTGESDLVLRVVATDLEAFGDFTLSRLLSLPGVADIRSSFIIGRFKTGPRVPV